jgi:streptogramin lyase
MLVVALAGGIAALVGILAAIFLSRGDGSGVPGPIPASGPSRAIHFANGVAEIDPKTGAIGKRVATSGSPGVLPTIVSGEGAVWITQTSNVLRVNPRTGRARAVSVGSYVFDVAVGQGAMWACASAGLFRIDPATEKVVDQIQIRFNLGIGGCYVIASPGAAWVATQPGVIVRVDTGSDRAGQPRKVASSILAMTYGFHALWVLDDAEGVVVKLDPRTGKPIGRFAVGGNPRTMAVGLGSIWVGDSTGTVSKIDPESGAVTGPIRVGAGPTSISTGFGKVWVANRDDETISRIDPVTNDVSEIPVNAPIAAVTVDSQSHKLWVAVG